jgi:hypothetical protein
MNQSTMVNVAQLSLCDTASVVQPAYKVGDLVKIRKRPIAASYLRKGDIVRVAAVHPIDGSIKFWNEHSERWEFVYPDEIGGIVSPAENNDSVSRVQIADTEYTVPPAENNDSVSRVQIADTEYTVPPAENNDSAGKAISTYTPRGTARSGEYFRLSYRDGSRMRHIHIRGGNTDSPIAQAKVKEVRSLLAAGVPVAEIASLIKEKKI